MHLTNRGLRRLLPGGKLTEVQEYGKNPNLVKIGALVTEDFTHYWFYQVENNSGYEIYYVNAESFAGVVSGCAGLTGALMLCSVWLEDILGAIFFLPFIFILIAIIVVNMANTYSDRIKGTEGRRYDKSYRME